MTAQALRHKRKLREAERIEHVRQETLKAILCILVIMALCILMGLAEGPSDAELDAREIARWEAQGVTIQRW